MAYKQIGMTALRPLKLGGQRLGIGDYFVGSEELIERGLAEVAKPVAKATKAAKKPAKKRSSKK